MSNKNRNRRYNDYSGCDIHIYDHRNNYDRHNCRYDDEHADDGFGVGFTIIVMLAIAAMVFWL